MNLKKNWRFETRLFIKQYRKYTLTIWISQGKWSILTLLSKSNHCYGFLYNHESQKFLLQQNSAESEWALLESSKLSKFKLLPIYDYVVKGEKHTVCYGEVKKMIDFPNSKWFTLKEISKLHLAPQTKQDIIVGQRVIASSVRRDAGELTIG